MRSLIKATIYNFFLLRYSVIIIVINSKIHQKRDITSKIVDRIYSESENNESKQSNNFKYLKLFIVNKRNKDNENRTGLWFDIQTVKRSPTAVAVSFTASENK